MTREERLQFCKICMHRSVDLQKGMLCGLTNTFADFENSCVDFKEDQQERKRLLIRDLDASGDQDAGQSLNFKTNKITGALIFVAGIAVLLFFIYQIEATTGYIIPISIIAFGIRTFYKGLEQEKVMSSQNQLDHKIKKQN